MSQWKPLEALWKISLLFVRLMRNVCGGKTYLLGMATAVPIVALKKT
jgi:hypothetical protein